ncbi:tRNA (guanosine(46)-N7)-methyltransferase TrmB [Geofilum sp. OHC36d9]|uniref:tRNA (guanosine(46)-N7)-methyltransferase TrmB n=1 Tax=Geofilum sp. OHC36d9 TaxID=3458413 RepID=UPI0040341469
MAKNKLQKFAEMDAFSHVIQASFDEVFRNDYKLKGLWAKNFFKNDHPIILELGCGKGEYTVGLADRFKETNFIGVDIKGARMHTGACQAVDKELNNVAFIRTRIELIDSFFSAGEVSEIWLTFPDPQMNKAKKRLSGTRFLTMYAHLLKPGGKIHLKTDSNFLYNYTREMAKVNKLTVLSDYNDLYNSDFVNDILSIHTYYEERFMSHGIPIKYFSFLLDNVNPLIEPEVDIPFDEYHNAGRSVKFLNDGEER